MSKIVTHQFLDTVFKHITHYQCDKQRHRKIAISHLERECHCGGKDHGKPGSDTVVDLFHEYTFFLLTGSQEQITFDILLQYTSSKNKLPVLRRIILIYADISLLFSIC
ncbi:hypothetical protein SDC9_210289 [bioreactor metagenome]|uniref:Uncharacterized protein n=1 Tax=bioreactor metagenome TaxID=1076179 RepID=A0A645JHG2_9ZZZZ